MVSLRNLALAASAIITLTPAAQITEDKRQSWTSGEVNNTREFYIKMCVTSGDTTYDGWLLAFYHTGAATADPVFVNGTGSRGASPAYLNGTNLQFDISQYPFVLDAPPNDTNYARWESTDIIVGYGSTSWYLDEATGLQVNSPESGGWLVCEWWHDLNAPQLFQYIPDFDPQPSNDFPSSCARVLLVPEYI